ncbi:MAG: Smr/MutS family protein [Pseudomonadota bacterium]
MTTKPQSPPDTDAALLARELAGVRPLAGEPRAPTARERFDREMIERRRAAASEHPAADTVTVDGLGHVAAVAADARLEFRRDGLQLRQWQKLRKGQIPWQLGVDLHGTTRADALRAVDRLIRQAQDEGSNCVRIVHGKGLGSGPDSVTLKAEVNHWLQRDARVLAFCSAPAHEGGAGALYVLLRRAGDRGHPREP